MITVTLYHLADQAEHSEVKHLLEKMQQSVPHQLIEIDVARNPEFIEKVGSELPRLECGPYHLRWPFTEQDLTVVLIAASQRREYLEQTGDRNYQERVERGSRFTGLDRFVLWLSRHYMAVFNTVLFLFVGLAFLAPVLAESGQTRAANLIYKSYSILCHQLAFRSYFLFGEQAFYPLERAEVAGVAPYEQVIGEADILAAREFIGDEKLGYKTALCERDIAIYLGFLGFGLLFSILKNKGKPLNWLVWIIVGIFPIAVDGVSQLPGLATNLPAWLPIRESTPLLRTVTGLLFGVTTAWFLFPYVAESMKETRTILLGKLEYIQQMSGKGG